MNNGEWIHRVFNDSNDAVGSHAMGVFASEVYQNLASSRAMNEFYRNVFNTQLFNSSRGMMVAILIDMK